MAEIVSSVKIQDFRDMDGIFKLLMRMGQKMNSDHLPHLIESQNVQRAKTCCSE